MHTGQHYDFEMSESFFRELSLPTPDVNLGITAASPAAQVGAMVPAIARGHPDVGPSMTIVFGDTSSTLAGALASAFGRSRSPTSRRACVRSTARCRRN